MASGRYVNVPLSQVTHGEPVPDGIVDFITDDEWEAIVLAMDDTRSQAAPKATLSFFIFFLCVCCSYERMFYRYFEPEV